MPFMIQSYIFDVQCVISFVSVLGRWVVSPLPVVLSVLDLFCVVKRKLLFNILFVCLILVALSFIFILIFT